MTDNNEKAKETITVAGVTFSADQVQTVTVVVDGREIQIGEKQEDAPSLGFRSKETAG